MRFGEANAVLPLSLNGQSIFFFLVFKILFIYLFLAVLVFVAAHRLSLVAESRGYSSLRCGGFSCCRAWALGVQAQ